MPASREEPRKRQRTDGSTSASAKDRDSSATKDSAAVPATAPPPKVSKKDLYADLARLEEEQSRDRTPEEDMQLFSGTCADIRKNLKDMLDLKIKKGPKAATDLTELRIQATLSALTLKKLNRLDKLRTRTSREATAGGKGKVDALHLQLQNLLYEVLHLQKEVTKCQQFKSKDEEVELIPVEEFYSVAPEEISKREATSGDEHQQKLARLEYENEQRKDMNAAFMKLEEAKEGLEKFIRDKRESLANLKPQLASILEKTKPVQDYLRMPLTAERDQLQLCGALPKPLFVLYNQLSGYGTACDPNIRATIVGDLDEARNYRSQRLDQQLLLDGDKDDEDADGQDSGNGQDSNANAEEGGGGGGGKKNKRKAKNQATMDEEKLKRIFAAHPLSVELAITLDADSTIKLAFSHVSVMNVVAVKTTLALGEDASSEKEVLLPSSVFAHLHAAAVARKGDVGEVFFADSGSVSPNPATDHLLRRMLPSSTYAALKRRSVELAGGGQMFYWAQLLAGMEFPRDATDAAASAAGVEADTNGDEDESEEAEVKGRSVRAEEEVSQTRVELIVGALKERLRARVALQRQLDALVKAKTNSTVPPLPEEEEGGGGLRRFPARVSSRISGWKGVDYAQYTALAVTQHLVGAKAVDGSDFFYRLQVTREPATLIALIAVKPDYPRRAPVFCLNLHWDGEHNVHNSENIRELERLINTDFSGRSCDEGGSLLTVQIRSLLSRLDVLLEAMNDLKRQDGSTGGGGEEKVDFPKEKLFLANVSGRTRAPPLSYNPELQIYTH